MRALITVLAVFSFSSLISQNHVGLTFGLTSTNTKSNQIFNDSEARNGFQYGVLFERAFNERIGFETGLRYTERGFIDPIEFTDNEGNTIANGESAFDYNYLSLPLLARLSAGNELKGTFKAGLCPSILLEAETTTPPIESFPEESFDVTERVTQIDIAGIFGVEVSYDINESFTPFASFNYIFGLNEFTNDAYFKDENARHLGTTFQIGIKYELKNKKDHNTAS